MLLCQSPSFANDIKITNTILIPGADGNPDRIQLDIAWENSWRHPFSTGNNNWDAAWVFIKYREAGNSSAAWSHLYLSNAAEQYAAGTWSGVGPSGAVIDPALSDPRVDGSGNLITAYSPAINGNPSGQNPVMGAFVYRENVGRGRFEVSEMEFAFSRAENGMDINKLYNIQVFAIEMVYVPQGSFFVGSGGTEEGSFRAGGSTNPFKVSNSWDGCIANTSGCLWGASTSGISTIGGTGNLHDHYPTGVEGFYSMKYSVSQQQYVDFLNTLTTTQATERRMGGGTRNGITVSGGVHSTTNPYVSNNIMSWMDGAAYMDWAGLRPMTELEYEKAARGSLNTVANEYAWGTATIAALPYTLSNAGAENEAIATNYSLTAGNAMYTSTQEIIVGPVRVGIFGTATSNRVQSGASFWGIMELSGNLWERPVTVGNATGRAFTGLHGDGALSTAGNANVVAWPGLSSGEVTGAAGSGFRGGSRVRTATDLRVSCRNFAAWNSNSRSSERGFRGVRTAGCVYAASAPTIDTSGGLSPSEASAGQLATYKVTGTGSYLWIVPNDWQIVSGQGTNEIKVIVGATFPGTVRVAAVNACGSGTETTIQIGQ